MPSRLTIDLISIGEAINYKEFGNDLERWYPMDNFPLFSYSREYVLDALREYYELDINPLIQTVRFVEPVSPFDPEHYDYVRIEVEGFVEGRGLDRKTIREWRTPQRES